MNQPISHSIKVAIKLALFFRNVLKEGTGIQFIQSFLCSKVHTSLLPQGNLSTECILGGCPKHEVGICVHNHPDKENNGKAIAHMGAPHAHIRSWHAQTADGLE